MKLISVGEIIWDVYPDTRCIGGAPLNFAAHAAACGAEVQLLSAVGDDALGAEARACLARFGVDDSLVATVSDAATGRCLVTLDEQGVPQYALAQDTAYDRLCCSAPTLTADVLAFGTLIQRSEHNRRVLDTLLAEHRFAQVFCDLNLRAPHYDADSVERCLRHATWCKISREELPEVLRLCGAPNADYRAAVRWLCERYPQLALVVVTLDADGAYVWDARTGEEYEAPAEPVEVVSTVGAGDSFGAAFAVTLFTTRSIPDALHAAIRRSAFVVSHKEAVPIFDI